MIRFLSTVNLLMVLGINFFAVHQSNGATIANLKSSGAFGFPQQAAIILFQKFVKDNSMQYVVGAGSESMTRYGVTGIPYAFIIGRNSHVFWAGIPTEKIFNEQVELAIAEN